MSKTSGLTHILTELSSLDEIGRSLKRSSRLKFTGISVSRRYLALGSSRGDAHIFARDTLKYLQIIFLEKETNPITSLALSPTEQHIGVASSSGFVAVFELNIDKRVKPEKVRQSLNHSGHTVTSFVWDSTGNKLFVGDDQGKISVVSVPTNKSKTIFSLPLEILAVLNVSICQMTWWQDKLLVSTLTFCYLFDTTKHTYSTIGTKKREGEFGACIFLEPNSQCPVIYCARPGSRMWEVDFDGKVLNTHQFRQLLSVPPVAVVSILDDSYTPSTKIPAQGGLSIAFNKMIHVGHVILTWSSGGLYLFDPINVKVMIWTDSVKDIKDVAVFSNEVYLFHENSKVSKLVLLPIYQVFQLLVARCKWKVMADLLIAADHINVQPIILKRVKRDLMENLITGLMENDDITTVQKIRATMEDVSEGSVDSLNFADDWTGSAEIHGYTRLPSGMIIVNDGSSARASPVPNFDLHWGKIGEHTGKDELREPFSGRDLRRALSPLWREEKQREASSVVNESLQTSHGLEEISDLEYNRLQIRESRPDGEQRKDDVASVLDEKDVSHSNDMYKQDKSIEFDKLDMTSTPTEPSDCEEHKSGHSHECSKAELSTHSHTAIHDLEEQTLVATSKLEGRPSTTSWMSDSGETPFIEINLYDETQAKTKVIENGGSSSATEVFETQTTKSKGSSYLNTISDVKNLEAKTKSPTDKANNSHTNAVAVGKQPEIFKQVKNEKGDKEVIFESVKPTKKKKKRKGSYTNTMTRSGSFQRLPTEGHMHVSLSCSDLSEKTLYACCDNEETNITLNIDDGNEEDREQVDGSAFDFRKASVGSAELCPVTEEQAVTSQLPWVERKPEVIPPLIDRLAAARSHSHTDENVPEDDLVDYLLSQKSSFLAIKDGLSSKLKTQTKSLLNKGKTLLVKSASPSPTSSGFFDLRADPALRVDILETIESLPEPNPEENTPQVSDNSEILSTLANQIESLCLKATRIEGQLKNHNLLLNPSQVGQLLDEWASELNQVSYEFHYLLWKKKTKDKAKNEKPNGNSADVSDNLTNSLSVPERAQHNCLADDKDENLRLSDTDSHDDLNDSLDNVFDHDVALEEKVRAAKRNSSMGDSVESAATLSNAEHPSSSTMPCIPVEYLRDTIQATDPFHLSPEQLKVFQNLTTLCLLSSTMGNVCDIFHLSEPRRRAELLYSFVPDNLHYLLTSIPESQEFSSTKNEIHSNLIDSSLVTPKQDGQKGVENKEKQNITCLSSVKLNSKISESSKDKTFSELHQALFLRLHFFAMDYAMVKEEVDEKDDNLSLCWIALVHCCQEMGKRDIINSLLADNQVNSAIDHLRSGILLHPSALLGHIYTLFERAPAKTSEFSGEIPSRISASDIIQLCWLTSRPPSDALLRYTKKFLINVAVVHRVAAFKKLCEHPKVRYHLLESLVPFLSMKYDEISQRDSAKSAVIQFINLLPPGWIRLIIAMFSSDEEREGVIEMGIKHRHWKLCVELLADSKQRNRMLKLIASIGDLDLLQGSCLPQTVDEWRIFFKHCIENMRKEKNIMCEKASLLDDKKCQKASVKGDNTEGEMNTEDLTSHGDDVENSRQLPATQDKQTPEISHEPCDSAQQIASTSFLLPQKAISLNDLGRCVYQNVSGVTAVDLLMEFMKELEGGKESLGPDLLSRYYTDFRILMKQDHICHQALERMSVYMWTQQPSYLPPSVNHVVKSEASGSVKIEDELMSQINRLQLTSSEEFREEHVGNHWGRDIDIDKNCPSCNISLHVSLTLDTPGVIVFPCGHAFHKRCICNQTCPFMH